MLKGQTRVKGAVSSNVNLNAFFIQNGKCNPEQCSDGTTTEEIHGRTGKRDANRV